MQFEKEKMNEILKNHELWLSGNVGERADLYGADLFEADLRGTNIDYASWPMW